MSIFSTDLDREQKERIDPKHTLHLLGMVFTLMFVGLLICIGIMLVMINADSIDSYLNTPRGALSIVIIFGAFGIWRFICLVKNMIR